MLQFVIAGLVLGGIYAIASAGLVITYTSSGILNFAFGAIAFFIARFYYYLHTQHGWSIALSAIVSVVIAAPALGVLLYAVLFRFLRLSSPLIKVVATIGLLVAFPALATWLFGNQAIQEAPGLAPQPVHVYQFLGVPVTLDQVIVYICVVLTVVIGAGVLRYTEVGLKVRAMVDSPAMTDLSGTNPTADLGRGLGGQHLLRGALWRPRCADHRARRGQLHPLDRGLVRRRRGRAAAQLASGGGRRAPDGGGDLPLPALPTPGQPMDDGDHRCGALHRHRALLDLQPGPPGQGGGRRRVGWRAGPGDHAAGREPAGRVDQQRAGDRVPGLLRQVRRAACADRGRERVAAHCRRVVGGAVRLCLRLCGDLLVLDHCDG